MFRFILIAVVIFLIFLCIVSLKSRDDMTNNIITVILTAVSIAMPLLVYFFPQQTVTTVNNYYNDVLSKNSNAEEINEIKEINTKYYLDDNLLDIPLDKLLLRGDKFFISLDAVKKVMLKDEIVISEDNSKLNFKSFKENTIVDPDIITAKKYSIDYYVDGVEFHKPTSFNSILYNDKPYIQFSDLSILTDKIVSYEDKTKSVHISEKEKDYTKQPDFLLTPDNCFSYDGSGWLQTWQVGGKDNDGNTYKYDGIYSGGGNKYNNNSITYKPNSEYTVFSGVVALSHTSRGDQGSYTIKISFDGVEKQSFHISGGIAPIPFNWNITGVNEIEILRLADGFAEILIVDAGFYK